MSKAGFTTHSSMPPFSFLKTNWIFSLSVVLWNVTAMCLGVELCVAIVLGIKQTFSLLPSVLENFLHLHILELLSLRCWTSKTPHFLIIFLPISSLFVFVLCSGRFPQFLLLIIPLDFWSCYHILISKSPIFIPLRFIYYYFLVTFFFYLKFSSSCTVSVSS